MFVDRDDKQLKSNEYTEQIRVINGANRKGPQIENDLTEEGHLLHRNTDICQLRMEGSRLEAWLCLVFVLREVMQYTCLRV